MQVVKRLLEPYVFQWCSRHGGSISAEHGLGVQKRDVMHFSQTPVAMQLMGRLKNLLDPKGILNPNKVVSVQQAAESCDNFGTEAVAGEGSTRKAGVA